VTNPSSHLSQFPHSFAIEDKKHLKTHIKVVLDDLTPGTEDGLPFGPMPPTQEEQLSKLFAHELAFLNSSASSSSSDLNEQLSQDQDGSERGSEDQLEDQEGHANTSFEDLLDDATLSETSEETSVGDELSSAGNKDLAFDSSPSSPLTPSSPTFSHGTSTPPRAESINDSNDQALVVDHSPPLSSVPAETHGPSLGTVSFSRSTPYPHTHTPSPLSQPPLQPQPASAADATASSSSVSEPVETLITPGAAAENSDKASHQTGNSTILTTEEDGKR
jgi:hypothetical protein